MSHYTVGVPARKPGFYGRQVELKQLTGSGGNRAWNWVCSQRRIGKTSLLYRAKEEINVQGGLAFLHDLSGVEEKTASGKELLRCFLSSQAKELKPLNLKRQQLTSMDPALAFRTIVDQAMERFPEVAIIFDEAERLIHVERNDPGFLAKLRGELHALPGFRFILSATQLLSQLFDLDGAAVSSYLGTFSWLPLSGLEDDAAEALIRCHHSCGWSKPLPAEIVAEALEWTGGHPLLLQEIGMRLAELAQFDGRRVTLEMLRRCRQQLVANPGLRSIIADDYRRLTAPQRKLIDALCESNEPLTKSDAVARTEEDVHALEQAAAMLESLGYLQPGEPWQLRLSFYRQMRPPNTPPAIASPERVERSRLAHQRRRSIFISYGREDASLLKELTKILAPALPRHNIDLWDDHRIEPGATWREEIDHALARADAAILLISPAFLSSRFIAEVELPKLLDRAAQQNLTIWLLFARPSLVEEVRFDIGGSARPLTSFQGLNAPRQPLDGLTKAERTDALVQASKKLLQQLQERAPGQAA